MTLTATGPAGSPHFPDDPDPVLYGRLLRRAHVTGRCPVWIHPDDLEHTLDRPTDPRALAEAIDALDGRDVLDRWWPGPCSSECPCGEALPAAIPQATAVAPETDPAHRLDRFDAAVELVECPPRSLAVVDAYRPADTPAALGWAGICNYPHQDLVSLAAVLRYWESRWGALVVFMSRSRMELSVARPPMYDDECEQAAAEHIAFCPDQQDPQNGDFYTLSRYAGMIRGARSWHFWWD
ncbi:hypothetical protein Ae168Ps1_5851c [Pseudonocardia sp. Ae168_Ps1]|uniref:DUF4253 domain-containing protein n=1 Tax=unclassified Pseudonocardia TaxID=2619320 RepID=UPI00094AE6C6|nr:MULTISPECIES: DUF4253 domain-containing protein [unclassified Pseudonocardia]OLL71348.1 hypothetical protein Ae168Ps1_5851c [Pseudonocardia sp. Ae168_Ps1]OLL77101.1 hypothetical protein Ae150APs1_5479 [Pseudonocardia sp. Ae150A_Ps1]OLL88791.1 hypothetical protein Ae263Ps1_5846c [Pseudonocardia sp. Ae263_Ps1]OLL91189.1 hypothetical protein Ae356Ps1_1086 [Pseudonocardia sp. Ae356_Ps1]